MTCNDCVHIEPCRRHAGNIVEMLNAYNNAEKCIYFKKASLFLELPCEIGRTVFIIGSKYRHGRIEHWINTGKFKLSDIGKLGKTVFLSPEKAKQALKEMQANG